MIALPSATTDLQDANTVARDLEFQIPYTRRPYPKDKLRILYITSNTRTLSYTFIDTSDYSKHGIKQLNDVR